MARLPFGKNYLYLSKNEGKTWSSPIVVNDSRMDERDVGLCALPNNGLLMTVYYQKYVDENDVADTKASLFATRWTLPDRDAAGDAEKQIETFDDGHTQNEW